LLIAPFVLLVTGLPACSRASVGSRSTGPTAYERVIQSKTLRVAYISYPPSFVKDANTGVYSGIMNDVLQEVAKNLGLTVEYVEETAWGSMLEEVRTGRVDLVCTGLWPTSRRGILADFTEPVYFSPVKAYVKAGNTAFDGNLSAVNARSVKIATIDGEMTSIIAAADYPQATAEAHPQTTDIAQMLLEVANGKAAVTFVEPAVAHGFMQRNPGAVAEVRGVAAVRVFPNVMMVAKGETNLLSMLNTALGEAANTGIIDRIVARYEGAPGLFYRRQLPYRPATP